jgi:hypothetical protein
MSQKVICDFCRNEIVSHKFIIDISDDSEDSTVQTEDACRGCMNRLRRMLAFLKKPPAATKTVRRAKEKRKAA